ncbi:GDP-mannose 4,6-dehydratase [Lichenicoccus sp.]|uniref:GDP-mannose 4,6-dehydratase n=1 Tax=Lichenicoccus sp. TaxID=2781899 RepID=UPI003D0DF7FF
MPPRRILATGLTGFSGRHLQPAVASILPDAELVPLDCDLTDADAVAARVRDVRPDACIHLAAIAAIGAAGSDPAMAWRVNLHGTLALADALVRCVPGAALVHVSSGDAYGRSFTGGIPLDERAALAPMNVYGATKAAADLALGAIAGPALHVVRLRPFNQAGPGQSDAFALPAFAHQVAMIARGLHPPVLQVGNLDPERDFLDVRDVARAYALTLARVRTLPNGTILNLASGTPRRIGALLDDLLALAGITPAIEADPARMRPSDIPRAIGDASRARALLDWAPEIAWDRTLADVLDDWMQRVGSGNT